MSRLSKKFASRKPIMVLGIAFTIFGVMILLLQFITMTTHVEGIHIGPFRTDAEAKTTIPVSPIIGGIVLAGGIALFIIGLKKNT